jgi:hypothetical protein
MNDEFITQSIEEDRYLKALRLTDRFETEVEGELRRVADEFTSENENLFEEEVNHRFGFNRDPGPVIAHARINTNMNRVASKKESADTLTLNITLRWLDPAEYGLSHIDGTLCVTAYKINGAISDDHNRVKQRTKSDSVDVQFFRDAYNNAPGLVYVPVETAAEIRNGFETLKQHFGEYGEEYGVDPDSVE